jgi:ethanolamine utilization protein EutA (predicted chaperonin)
MTKQQQAKLDTIIKKINDLMIEDIDIDAYSVLHTALMKIEEIKENQ